MSTEAHTHDEPEQDPGAKPRRRRLAAVAVAAAVILTAGGTYFAQALTGDDSTPAGAPATEDKDPEPLTLDGYSGPGKPENATGSPYVLSGKAGQAPSRAPVYRATKVDPETAAKLADTLGIKAKLRKDSGTWVARDGRDGTGPALRVSGTAPGQQGQWSFSRHSPSLDPRCGKLPQPDKPPRCPSFQGDLGSGAEHRGGPDGPTQNDSSADGGDPVSEKEAEAAVGPVLDALGLDGAVLDAGDTTGALRTVEVQPRLDGVPVQGWDTRLTVDSRGEVVRGHGALAPLSEGSTYPLLDAERTLAQLNKQRAPQTEIHCVKEPCEKEESRPIEVNEASFVLAAHSSHGKRVLVPSWSFAFDTGSGNTKSVTHPALAPRHLAAPNGTGSDKGSRSEGESPGVPAPGHTTEPKPGGLSVEAHTSGDRTLTVHFWGGACSDYSVKAKETKDRVQLNVSERERDPGAPCIKIAKAMSDEVTLDERVGDRELVDEHGERLREH